MCNHRDQNWLNIRERLCRLLSQVAAEVHDIRRVPAKYIYTNAYFAETRNATSTRRDGSRFDDRIFIREKRLLSSLFSLRFRSIIVNNRIGSFSFPLGWPVLVPTFHFSHTPIIFSAPPFSQPISSYPTMFTFVPFVTSTVFSFLNTRPKTIAPICRSQTHFISPVAQPRIILISYYTHFSSTAINILVSVTRVPLICVLPNIHSVLRMSYKIYRLLKLKSSYNTWRFFSPLSPSTHNSVFRIVLKTFVFLQYKPLNT